MENRAFRTFEGSVWKLLDSRILHQIPQGFWGPCAAPKPPVVLRNPLWKFLPTGLHVPISLLSFQMAFLKFEAEQKKNMNKSMNNINTM